VTYTGTSGVLTVNGGVLFDISNPGFTFNTIHYDCPILEIACNGVDDIETSPQTPDKILSSFQTIGGINTIESVGSIGVVPEPSSITLLGVGAIGLLGYARYNRRRSFRTVVMR
jgi:hypothetical protein